MLRSSAAKTLLVAAIGTAAVYLMLFAMTLRIDLAVDRKVQLSLDLANVLMIVLTTIIGFVAVYELVTSHRRDEQRHAFERSISQETMARDLYRDYLKMAIEYPHLSAIKFDKNDLIVMDQYDTYISTMLYSFDRALAISKDSSIAIGYEIKRHIEYIETILAHDVEDDSNYRSNYEPPLLAIIDQIVDECRAERGRKRLPHGALA